MSATGQLEHPTLRPLDREHDGFDDGTPELVLVGPPGTGKTRAVMDLWLKPALESCLPSQVLACSFSKAAAGEIRNRLSAALGLDFRTLKHTCSTIHSESFRLVRSSGRKVSVWDGEKKDRKAKAERKKKSGSAERKTRGPQKDIFLAAESGNELVEFESPWEGLQKPSKDQRKEAVRVWELVRHKYPHDLESVPLVQLLKRECGESPFRASVLVAEVRAYEARKESIGAIDFTDMLLLGLEVAPPHRRLLIVDEAQDLSLLQILVIRHWATRADQLVWVGDPDQGIYGWAGADGRLITDMIRNGVPACSLQQSWRVPRAIYELARRVILLNNDRIDAPYEPCERQGALYKVDTIGHVVGFAVEAAEDEEDPKDVFILARATKSLPAYAQGLMQAGVLFTNERGKSPIGKRAMVATILTLDKLTQSRPIGKSEALALCKLLPAKPKGRFFAGLKKDAVATVRELPDGAMLTPAKLQESGIRLAEIHGCSNVTEALAVIGKKEEADPLLMIVQRYGTVEALTWTPRITLTTMHASKGREAHTVIIDLEAPYPTRRGVQKSREIKRAERRVLYVAITRAKSVLGIVKGERCDLAAILDVEI